MRPNPSKPKSAAKKRAEQAVQDIRRATRRHFPAEDKIRIVLDGLRGEDTLVAGSANTVIGLQGLHNAQAISSGGSANASVGLLSGADTYNWGTTVFSGITEINAGAGKDTIIAPTSGGVAIEGGAGNDTLTGGAGIDTFIYHAGFGNDTLGDFFLKDLLERGRGWEAIPDDTLCRMVSVLGRNPRMRTARDDDYMDGWDEYSYGSVFNAAWKLAETAPVTAGWASSLGWLYEQLQPDAFSIKEPLKLAERWHIDPADKEANERQAKDHGIGYLGNMERVRKGLARLELVPPVAS